MMFTVYLYKVGRNLNRCIRTAYSFGVDTVALIGCPGKIEGNLYSAKNVRILQVDNIPENNILDIEIDGMDNIYKVDFSIVHGIIIGGESVSIPKRPFVRRAKIPTATALCLTAEAALSIVLSWRHYVNNLR